MRSPCRGVAALLAPVLAAVLSAGVLVGCGPGAQPDADRAVVRVASYDFPENQVLAEVYAEGLRRAGFAVVVEHGAGTREVLEPALEQGVVDLLVDYLGTALTFVRSGSPPDPAVPQPSAQPSPAELQADLAAELSPRGVSVLAPARAEDQNGFVVRAALADRHGLSRLSDLVDLAPELDLGGPPECASRPLCAPGLERLYGLSFRAVVAMPSRAATVEALLAGEVDVGMLETTDPHLTDPSLRLLADDRRLQPPENVVPLVRTAVLDAAGDRMRAALDGVSARLTTADLIVLNRAVDVDGFDAAEAAQRWWSTG